MAMLCGVWLRLVRAFGCVCRDDAVGEKKVGGVGGLGGKRPMCGVG
jgi:hypothetical protein